MGIVSVRLTDKEDKILSYLAEHFDEDKSTLIKHSILDLYEDLKDMEIIENFEKRERRGKIKFTNSAEIIKKLK